MGARASLNQGVGAEPVIAAFDQAVGLALAFGVRRRHAAGVVRLLVDSALEFRAIAAEVAVEVAAGFDVALAGTTKQYG